MSPYWQNNTCSPFTSGNASCTMGNLALYAINVTNADDIRRGIEFSKDKNIRLVIRNTGHDYIGRSAGKGALSLWTHNLKSIEFIEYESAAYSGPAAKVGAGTQFFELYAAAADRGLRVVGGYCPSVGIAGGYITGGGHGPLGALYGLGADNTLEFEVITSDGRHLTASRTEHADLYWALSGGGSGVFAVVLSATVKAHVDGPVAGFTFNFSNTNDTAFFSAIESWQTQLLTFDELLGFSTVWSFSKEFFEVGYATWPGASVSEIQDALTPFLRDLESLGIKLENYEANQLPTFWDHYQHFTGSMPYGPYTINDVMGGRIIPRSTVRNNATTLVGLLRDMVNISGFPEVLITGISNNFSHARVGSTAGSNAVLPAWRDSLYFVHVDFDVPPGTSTKDLQAMQAQMNTFEGWLRDLTPTSGGYLNEGCFDNPVWKEDYFGENYDRLMEIKSSYDPELVLYAHTSVGSDLFTVEADGRVCGAS